MFWTNLMLASVIILQLIIGGILLYGRSYIKKKAENLAQIEDLDKMTKIVEEIKKDYALILENAKARNQLKMAALDKRLEVHQKAYTQLRKLIEKSRVLPDTDFSEKIKDARNWWEENCLYLEEKGREAFITTTNTIWNYRDSYKAPEPRDLIRLENMWNDILLGVEAIVSGIELPPIKEDKNLRGE